MSWYKHSREHRIAAMKGMKKRRNYNRLSSYTKRRFTSERRNGINLVVTDVPFGKISEKDVYFFNTKRAKRMAPVANAQITHIMKKHPEVLEDLVKTNPRAVLYTSVPDQTSGTSDYTGGAIRTRVFFVRPPKGSAGGVMVTGTDKKQHEKYLRGASLYPKSNHSANTFLHENQHIKQFDYGKDEEMKNANKKYPYEDRPHEIEARVLAKNKINKRLLSGKYPTGEEISKTLKLEHGPDSDKFINWGEEDKKKTTRDERIDAALSNIYRKNKTFDRKVLICGDRNWSNREKIKSFLSTLPKDTIIVEGEASGADRIAREESEKLGLQVKKYPADWKKYGRSAGPIRNRQMLNENPDLVVAFHNNINSSKGTKDTLTEANRRKIQWELKTE
jgi:hypothetical protein